MDFQIKDIALDKKEYVYGLDEEIQLFLVLQSRPGVSLKHITITYQCDFYGNKQRHKAFRTNKIVHNVRIKPNTAKEFVFHLPIEFFNIPYEDFHPRIKVENVINIKISEGFLKNTKKKVYPNVKFDEDKYDLRNIYIYRNKKEKQNVWELKNQLEQLITKSKYIDTYGDSNIDFLEDIMKKKGPDEMAKYFDIWNQKQEEFLINPEYTEKYQILKRDKDLLEKNILVYDSYHNMEFYNLVNQWFVTNHKMYGCYYSSDEKGYNKLLKKYIRSFSNIYEVDYILKQKDIEKNKNFVEIRKHFRGVISYFINKIFYNDAYLVDYIHKNLFSILRKNLFIRIFDMLAKSKVYSYIKNAIFIFALFLLIDLISGLGIFYKNISSNGYWLLCLFVIGFVVLSLFLEWLYQKILYGYIYNYKLHPKRKLEKNISKKLGTGDLNIYDIFEYFDVKLGYLAKYFRFYVSLEMTIESYYRQGKRGYKPKSTVLEVDLFDALGMGHFDSNQVKLLENNYIELAKILPDHHVKHGAKVYYKLKYSFSCPLIPDLAKEKKLRLKFYDMI